MGIALYIIIVLLFLSFCQTIILVITAPKGYEDESGFHYGLPKDVEKEQSAERKE